MLACFREVKVSVEVFLAEGLAKAGTDPEGEGLNQK